MVLLQGSYNKSISFDVWVMFFDWNSVATFYGTTPLMVKIHAFKEVVNFTASFADSLVAIHICFTFSKP